MATITINGARHVTTNAMQSVLRSYGVDDRYENVVITITSKPSIKFAPGDVYLYKYDRHGQEYTLVRKAYGWTDDSISDADILAAVRDGRAHKAKVVRA